MFPVDKILPEIGAAFADNRIVIVRSPPGSGKTTRIAPYLLENETWLKGRKIIILEPRRLAARMAAGYMAGQLGEKVGQTVGYRVRLENFTGPTTRIEILTEGLLTQKLLRDPELSDTGAILFDEFHERSLAADTGLAMALEARSALREDLRLGILSATIDTEYLQSRLPNCAVLTAEGRQYPVETRYLPDFATCNYCKVQQVADTVLRTLQTEPGGILVFLPGEGEIRRTAEILAACDLPVGVTIHPLFGSLSRESQNLAVRPDRTGERKVVLATSIAESSVTIEGIHTVIDSGWVRVPKYSAGNGMSALVTQRITLDRADQRQGRAGRLENGLCLRLWDEATLQTLRPNATPEILDADLSQTALQCAEWGTCDRLALPWLTPPDEASWNRALRLLEWLGALKDSRITKRGKAMARFPVHPRLSGMLVTAREMQLGARAAFIAAAISEAPSIPELRKIKDLHRLLSEAKTHHAFSKRVNLLAAKWMGKEIPSSEPAKSEAKDALLLALAFPDRIAKRRSTLGRYLLCNGTGACIDAIEPLAACKWLVCAELKDNCGGDAEITLAAAIDEQTLRENFEGRIVRGEEVYWEKSEEAVKARNVEKLGAITLSEKPISGKSDAEGRTTEVLMQAVLNKGLDALPWDKNSIAMRQRVQFLHRHLGDEWPEWSDGELRNDLSRWLAPFCTGITRWQNLLRELNLTEVLRAYLIELGLSEAKLDSLAPTHCAVPSGSKITIHYDNPAPYLSVRIQEVFGMTATPRIAGGRVPLTMQLLSPAQRPVQVTSDLESFWNTGYALVRKDLRGRYPKHYWPEDPHQAIATRRVRPR